MKKHLILWITIGFCISTSAMAAPVDQENIDQLEKQFHTLPMESRRLTGPLFWLHGNESKELLERYVGIVAEGGNGCFTTESRPHVDWLGEGWYRDLSICLDAAKKHNLQMWIFDEKWWPSQGVGSKVPPRYAAKQLHAEAVDVKGPGKHEAKDYDGPKYVAALAGRIDGDGKIEGDTLVDLSSHIHNGKLSWPIPEGAWKVMKFTHKQAPRLAQNRQLSVDGASKDCVDWFLQTVYQPHYDRFGEDFGKTIQGYFFDEPETQGDWGTELNKVLAEWGVDWKKAYVGYKFQLAGEEQFAARFQYIDALAEAWGRTMYGGITDWCHRHGVKSIGHFMEHRSWYYHRAYCAGDMMRLQGYCDMGGIDAVFDQFVMGKREGKRSPPCWQTPKLGSSISHVYGKQDDVAMVEIFGARGQDLTYPEMKWWTDHMQVSGINFMIPHSFNPKSPYDKDCPPFFYNNGYEPRWPLYRVYADYTNRLSLMMTGGRHVCPVALLYMGVSLHVGRAVSPEGMTTALQDAMIDCDWLPFSVFEAKCRIKDKELQLYKERYRILIVPPVEVIPYATMQKAKEFFEAGGVVVGYDFLPSRSATLGRGSEEITALRTVLWGDDPKPGLKCLRHNAAGGRTYLLPKAPSGEQLHQMMADAGVRPTLELLQGETSGWLHVLHRRKVGRDVFLICNQNHQGEACSFRFRATASGEPEWWDAVRNEITAIDFQKIDNKTVEFSLDLEPLESAMIVFRAKRQKRPSRIQNSDTPTIEPISLVRASSRPAVKMPPLNPKRDKTVSPLKAADPFLSRFTLPEKAKPSGCRIYLEMSDLPNDSASIKINGEYAGGVIGRPCRIEISGLLKAGENTVLIEPRAPRSARIVCYGAE